MHVNDTFGQANRRAIDFAHGEWVAAGMLTTAALAGTWGWPPLLTAPVLALAYFAADYGVQRLLNNRLLGAGEQAQFLLLLALSMVMTNLLLLAFGPDPRPVQTNDALDFLPWGPLIVDRNRAWAAVLAAAVALTLFAMLRATLVGQAIRAAADNLQGARTIGLPTERLFALAFGLGCACAGIAGTLLVTIEDATPASGAGNMLLAFSIVIAGGLGSLSGATLAGLPIGVSEAAAGMVGTPSAKSLASFAPMIGVLLWRPRLICRLRATVADRSSLPCPPGRCRAGMNPVFGMPAREHHARSKRPTTMTEDPARAPSGPLLRVDQVSVRFGGIVALDGVSFDVAAGEIAGLIGPNGAGKTTLFNCLSRLYPCERGRISFDGHDLLALPQHRIAGLGIGRTFQNLALFNSMSVLANVMVGSHCRTGSGFLANALRLPGAAREWRATEERARELLALLELGALAHAPVAALPFGTRKRVELARALAGAPKLLLLDEPASGLNHDEVHALGALIRGICDRLRLTVLLVEHHMGLVMGISNKVVALNFGRKIAEGTPAAVSADAAVIEAYLGSAVP
jgi:branched-chain amino acid transport system ATP-binding protein